MKRLVSVFVVLAIMTSGCGRYEIKRSLRLMKSEAIVFPEDLLCVLDGQVVDYDLPSIGSTLVVYVDSTECSKCRISDFYRYSELIEDHSINRNLFVLFLISPARCERDSILDYISVIQSDYPIFVDYDNTFGTLNCSIPANPVFHTFMLDSQNKILLVGDPLTNIGIAKLFDESLVNH